jgi:hypothetical protein
MDYLGISVGELRRQLEVFDDDSEIYAGGLTLYKLKVIGDKLVQIEFNEYVHRDQEGKLVIEEY